MTCCTYRNNCEQYDLPSRFVHQQTSWIPSIFILIVHWFSYWNLYLCYYNSQFCFLKHCLKCFWTQTSQFSLDFCWIGFMFCWIFSHKIIDKIIQCCSDLTFVGSVMISCPSPLASPQPGPWRGRNPKRDRNRVVHMGDMGWTYGQYG